MLQKTDNIRQAEGSLSVEADTRIYFDNAATTPLDPEVLQAMMPYLSNHFGNPSSIYSFGRETRLAIENARKSVAKIIGARPGEIFFTSGGTESNNMAIATAIRDLGCTHIITSAIEHHAVLHTVAHFEQQKKVTSGFVTLLADGRIDYDNLEEQLSNKKEKCLVSLMHANNETGTLLDIQRAGELCKKYNAIFHSDCVQTIGHYPIQLHSIPVHFISAAAHKFHGPKGVGILYVSEEIKIQPLLFGGGQERNMRAGTENVYGIVGFAKALEIATRNYNRDSVYIAGLKDYFKQQIQLTIPGVTFNEAADGNNLYTVLSVCFPKTAKSEMLLFSMDMNHICASGGSACSSGANAGSHVMQALGKGEDCVAVRFSFSKYNTKEEIDIAVAKLKSLV